MCVDGVLDYLTYHVYCHERDRGGVAFDFAPRNLYVELGAVSYTHLTLPTKA